MDSIVEDLYVDISIKKYMSLSKSIKDIKSIEIDPSLRMADVNRNNNKLVIPD
jgi:hypothetical protein